MLIRNKTLKTPGGSQGSYQEEQGMPFITISSLVPGLGGTIPETSREG